LVTRTVRNSRALQPLLSLNDEARLAMYAPDFALPEKFLEDAASLLGAQSWMLVRPPSEKKGAEGSNAVQLALNGIFVFVQGIVNIRESC
jgi:hypothetical protein